MPCGPHEIYGMPWLVKVNVKFRQYENAIPVTTAQTNKARSMNIKLCQPLASLSTQEWSLERFMIMNRAKIHVNWPTSQRAHIRTDPEGWENQMPRVLGSGLYWNQEPGFGLVFGTGLMFEVSNPDAGNKCLHFSTFERRTDSLQWPYLPFPWSESFSLLFFDLEGRGPGDNYYKCIHVRG